MDRDHPRYREIALSRLDMMRRAILENDLHALNMLATAFLNDGPARWYAGTLPTFAEMVDEAHRLVCDAADTMRSDWLDGQGPKSDEQAAARAAFWKHINAARNALDRATR